MVNYHPMFSELWIKSKEVRNWKQASPLNSGSKHCELQANP